MARAVRLRERGGPAHRSVRGQPRPAIQASAVMTSLWSGNIFPVSTR
ncbi:hypothetical protein OG338_00385 [Streptomyces sp. NBC_00726]